MASFDQFVPVLNKIVTLLSKIERHTECTACAGVEPVEVAVFGGTDTAEIAAGARSATVTNNSAGAEVVTVGGIPIAAGASYTFPFLPGGYVYPLLPITGDVGATWDVQVIS